MGLWVGLCVYALGSPRPSGAHGGAFEAPRAVRTWCRTRVQRTTTTTTDGCWASQHSVWAFPMEEAELTQTRILLQLIHWKDEERFLDPLGWGQKQQLERAGNLSPQRSRICRVVPSWCCSPGAHGLQRVEWVPKAPDLRNHTCPRQSGWNTWGRLPYPRVGAPGKSGFPGAWSTPFPWLEFKSVLRQGTRD